ncbi:uncharacterized protein LOC118197121 [Stegodyphus dumicola]|uniref:uncharacterized protein LOC118197121 n=1 Tax=Stegodyphus dumicola TaxID=202533 RepID=UPI0015B32E27|nr:uncharacterized protein LOC118197121 [Stegodyphus dumicola]
MNTLTSSPNHMDTKNSGAAKRICTSTLISTNKYPKFLVITGELENLSPFFIHKHIAASVGEPKHIKKLRSGSLLIETTSDAQSSSLQKMTKMGEHSITVSPHKSLNTSRGVISEIDLISVSEDELSKELAEQNVCGVRRIKVRRDGQLVNTKHLILSFSSPELPKAIKAGYLNCPIRPYVPNPLRCFKCQRFGHAKAACRGNLACVLAVLQEVTKVRIV